MRSTIQLPHAPDHSVKKSPPSLESQLRTAEHRVRALETELAQVIRHERRRVAQELHDGVGARLSTLQFTTRKLLEKNDRDLPRQIAEISQAIEEIGTEMQQVAHGISPWWIDGYSLSLALHQLAARTTHPGRLHCETICTGIPRHLPPADCLHFCRMAQEAVSNAIMHGSPRHIGIRMEGSARALTLTVEDNGAGFRSCRTIPGRGMRNLRARAAALNATLIFTTTPIGGIRMVCRKRLV